MRAVALEALTVAQEAVCSNVRDAAELDALLVRLARQRAKVDSLR